jgi:hypothetical protein
MLSTVTDVPNPNVIHFFSSRKLMGASSQYAKIVFGKEELNKARTFSSSSIVRG